MYDQFWNSLDQRFVKDDQVSFLEYKDDPVGFGEKVLGEQYSDEVKVMMESVRDYPVTIAISATGPGKTFAAARVATWFYLTQTLPKVFLAAAPPIDNLEDLLWAEMTGIVRQHRKLFKRDYITHLRIASKQPLSSKAVDVFDDDGEIKVIKGLTIPSSGTAEDRVAKFCADADDLFEMTDGSVVKYGDLIGKNDVPVISVDKQFRRKWSQAQFFDNGIKPVWEIEFNDGDVVRRTGNHPLYAAWDIKQDYHSHKSKDTHRRGRIRPHKEGWVLVSNLNENYAVLCPENTGFNFGTQKIDINRVKFLAYMIGDGCFMGKNKQSLRKGSEEKFIPDIINQLCKEQIAIFLNRLFSTDGWACICKCGSYKKAEIGYSSKSMRLVFDVQRLLNRFGIRSKILSKRIAWKHNGEKRGGIYWSLFINRATDTIRFADEISIYGKEDALKACREHSKGRQWDYGIWEFEKPGYRWKKVKNIRIIGEKPTVGVFVPENHTYLTSLVEHNSGKHAPSLLFIFDEGDAIPDEVYEGAEGCMSGGFVRMLILFNPKKETGEVYRMIKDSEANIVKLSAFNHPNVLTGEDVFPGAVTREETVRRINSWCRPLARNEKPNSKCFKLPDFLIGTVAKSKSGKMYPPLVGGYYEIRKPQFSYMVLGEYPAESEDSLISKEWTAMARSRWDAYVAMHGKEPPVGVRGIQGQDVAEMGDDVNSVCFRYGGFVDEFETWGDVDVMVSADRGTLYHDSRNIDRVYVDATGVGAGVAPAMCRKGVTAIGVKVASRPTEKVEEGEFKILRDQLCWKVREWLRTDQGAMLPPDEEMLEEMHVLTYEIKDGTIRVMKKEDIKEIIKRSCNKFDALALTFATPDLLFPNL